MAATGTFAISSLYAWIPQTSSPPAKLPPPAIPNQRACYSQYSGQLQAREENADFPFRQPTYPFWRFAMAEAILQPDVELFMST
jgi:hypothetical protein